MASNENTMWKIFREHHKAKPAGFAMIGEGVQNRIKEQEDGRKSRRLDTFFSNRLISDDCVKAPAVKQSNSQKSGQSTDHKKMPANQLKIEQRFQQLKKWQEEKKKKMDILQKKPKLKPFIVGVVHNGYYKPPSPLRTSKFAAQQSTRSTRSARLASNQAESSNVKKPNGTNNREQSFAPMNAKFHPPKNVAGRTMVFGASTAAITRSKDTFVSLDKDISTRTRTANRLNHASKPVVSKPPVAAKLGPKMTAPKPATKPPVKAVALPRKTIATRPKIFITKQKTIEDELKTIEADVTLPSDRTFCSSIELRNSSTPDNQNQTKSLSDAALSTPDTTPGNLSILSPFVTVARGKGNIDREKAAKVKMGYVSLNSEEKDTAIHFRLLLNGEITRLNDLCEEWSKYRTTNECTMPESAKDHIFLVIGQTKLLISKKFEQFRGLIDRCESQECVEGGGIVNAEDLQGFWDMIFIQVENIDKRFKALCKERDGGWKEENGGVANRTNLTHPNMKKTISKAKKIGPSAALKAMIKASRMKSKSGTEPETSASTSVDTLNCIKVFEGGFFKIKSPMNTPGSKSMIRSSTTPGKPSSVLKNVLSSEARKRLSLHKRMSSTPSSVALMRVSSTAKLTLSPMNTQTSTIPLAPINLNATPSKSILKTKEKHTRQHRTKKNSVSAKSVLFSHSGDDANTSKFTIDNISQAESENGVSLDKENVDNAATGRSSRRRGHSSKSESQEAKRILNNQASEDGNLVSDVKLLSLNTPKNAKLRSMKKSPQLQTTDALDNASATTPVSLHKRSVKENVGNAAAGRSSRRRGHSSKSESQEAKRISKNQASEDDNFFSDAKLLSLNTPKNGKLRSMKKSPELQTTDALDDVSATTPRRSFRLSSKK